jgi:hypothetical protein
VFSPWIHCSSAIDIVSFLENWSSYPRLQIFFLFRENNEVSGIPVSGSDDCSINHS